MEKMGIYTKNGDPQTQNFEIIRACARVRHDDSQAAIVDFSDFAVFFVDFSQYEICSEGGKWMTKTCQRGSMFWTIVSCCIPLGNFPVIDNCI